MRTDAKIKDSVELLECPWCGHQQEFGVLDAPGFRLDQPFAVIAQATCCGRQVQVAFRPEPTPSKTSPSGFVPSTVIQRRFWKKV